MSASSCIYPLMSAAGQNGQLIFHSGAPPPKGRIRESLVVGMARCAVPAVPTLRFTPLVRASPAPFLLSAFLISAFASWRQAAERTTLRALASGARLAQPQRVARTDRLRTFDQVGITRSAFIIHNSSFILSHNSSFIIHPSPPPPQPYDSARHHQPLANAPGSSLVSMDDCRCITPQPPPWIKRT